MTRRVATGLSALAAFAFPQRCPVCGAAASARRLLCAACADAVPRVPLVLCARCLSEGREPVGCAHAGMQVRAAWIYDPGAAHVVHALKFGGRTGLADALAGPLVDALPPRPSINVIVPLPLHAARRRERGYNQSEVLARALGRAIRVRVHSRALKRTRATPPQAGLPPDVRRRNLERAFEVREGAELEGRHVVLVDDVMTTGSTMRSALGCLEAAGAHASGLVLAWAQ